MKLQERIKEPFGFYIRLYAFRTRSLTTWLVIVQVLGFKLLKRGKMGSSQTSCDSFSSKEYIQLTLIGSEIWISRAIKYNIYDNRYKK